MKTRTVLFFGIMLFFTGCVADLMNIELEGDIAKWEELNIQAEALISTLQLNNYSSEWHKNAKALDEEIIQMNRQAEIKSEQLLGSRQYSKYSHLFRRIYMLSGDNDPEFTKKPASKIYQWKKVIRPVISQREYVRTHPSLNPKQKQCILDGKIALGMTKDMVIASWGDDTGRFTRNVTSNAIIETWYYGEIEAYSIGYYSPPNHILTFVDGKLTEMYAP